jgi:hypothetical protein
VSRLELTRGLEALVRSWQRMLKSPLDDKNIFGSPENFM